MVCMQITKRCPNLAEWWMVLAGEPWWKGKRSPPLGQLKGASPPGVGQACLYTNQPVSLCHTTAHFQLQSQFLKCPICIQNGPTLNTFGSITFTLHQVKKAVYESLRLLFSLTYFTALQSWMLKSKLESELSLARKGFCVNLSNLNCF